MSTFNDITMNSITGEPVKFSGFKGKVSLVVNVASQ
jgi:glutathione peroxidase-family protein